MNLNRREKLDDRKKREGEKKILEHSFVSHETELFCNQ